VPSRDNSLRWDSVAGKVAGSANDHRTVQVWRYRANRGHCVG
jgi:hypothetical protein